MATHNTSSIPNLTNYKGDYWDGFFTEAQNRYATASFVDKIFKKEKSDLKYLRLLDQSGLSVFVEIGEDGVHAPDQFYPGHSVEITIKEWGKVFSASRLLLDKTPNKYNIWRKYAFMMARAYKEAQALHCTSYINNMYTTAGADGQYIIDTDHGEDDSSDAWSNELSGNGPLTATNLESALINMWYPDDQRGKTMEITPTYLQVSPTLAPTAWKLTQKGAMPFTSDNTKNVMMDHMPLEVVVVPKRTSTTAWELVQKIDEFTPHPFIFWDDKALETYVRIVEERSKGEEYHGYGRFTAGYGPNSRGVYGSDGTGS